MRTQCILCPYKYEENCNEYDKCYSLANIYYGTISRFFPFKQIQWFKDEYDIWKYNKYDKNMDKKYGDSSLENDAIKHIWGVKSFDDLSGADCCLYTMNDIDITYDKKSKKYMLGIETAYMFDNNESECIYLKKCLDAFTKYMDTNNLDKNKKFCLFFSNPETSTSADSIEELYTNFKIFVDGFCNQNIN